MATANLLKKSLIIKTDTQRCSVNNINTSITDVKLKEVADKIKNVQLLTGSVFYIKTELYEVK